MKIILFIFLMTLSTCAFADDFSYTGNDAVLEDNNYISNNYIDELGNINSNAGLAQQFTISQPTEIQDLESTMTTLPTNSGTTTFQYDIYQGNGTTLPGVIGQVPNTKDVVAQSAPISISVPESQVDSNTTATETQQVSLTADLQPGTYWIAEQGSGGAWVTVTQDYIPQTTGGMPTAAAPELPTWMYFGLMPLGVLWRRLSGLGI